MRPTVLPSNISKYKKHIKGCRIDIYTFSLNNIYIQQDGWTVGRSRTCWTKPRFCWTGGWTEANLQKCYLPPVVGCVGHRPTSKNTKLSLCNLLNFNTFVFVLMVLLDGWTVGSKKITKTSI